MHDGTFSTAPPDMIWWREAVETVQVPGAVEKVSALVHSPPVEGWQAKPDGVVVVVLH